jgi:hypothetical protein
MWGKYADDYEPRLRPRTRFRPRKSANDRRIIRSKEMQADEIKAEGSKLLAKVVAAIPKRMGDKYCIRYVKGKQRVRINLSLHPSVVVHYVVKAFRVKGWKARHDFNDIDGYDYLELEMPDDWLKRVLGIEHLTPKSERFPTQEVTTKLAEGLVPPPKEEPEETYPSVGPLDDGPW